jgi:hypothetical protein
MPIIIITTTGSGTSSARAAPAAPCSRVCSGRASTAVAGTTRSPQREASDIAAAYKMETVGGTADLVKATVLAMRGDHEKVPPLLARVLAAVDEAVYRGSPPGPGTPQLSQRSAGVIMSPPTRSSASSSRPTARRSTITSPTTLLLTSLLRRRALNGASKPGRGWSVR